MKLLKALTLSLLLVGPTAAQPVDPYYEGMEAYVSAGMAIAPDNELAMKNGFPDPIYRHEATRAVFADGRLWLLSADLKLSVITPGATAAVEQALPGLPLDICLQDKSPVVVTGERGAPVRWTVRRWSGGTWTEQTHVAQGDYFLAAHCGAGGPTLLTNKRLIGPGARPRIVKLSRSLGEGRIAALYSTPEALFVGLDGGEFGGGLRRIDRKTGRVTIIARRATKDACSGPLTTDCDPVHGIAAAPWNSQCLVATIGLEHMLSHGRIVEICGSAVRSIYWAPHPEYGNRASPNGRDGEPDISVAFYGLTPIGDMLWAAAPDGLYKVERPGMVTYTSLPKFDLMGDVQVSFELPDMILIRDVGYLGRLSPPTIVPR